MITLATLAGITLILTIVQLYKLKAYENIHPQNSARRTDLVHHVKEPARAVEVFSLREQPVLLYHSLHNLYKKPK